jgi:uncharacterized coiled-coil protein SlyX
MKLNRICEALGEEQLEFEADGRRTFTLDEMQTLDSALGTQGADPSVVDTLQGALSLAESTIDRQNTLLADRERTIEELSSTLGELTEQVKNLMNTSPIVTDTVMESDLEVSGEGLTLDDIKLFNVIRK